MWLKLQKIEKTSQNQPEFEPGTSTLNIQSLNHFATAIFVVYCA